MFPVLSPDRLVDSIEQRVAAGNAGAQVMAFWYCVTGNRDAYARGIRSIHASVPIIPLIPRRAGVLEAPNALVSDLVQLIDESRTEIIPVIQDEWAADVPLAVLVLSRTPLSVSGGSSPTPFPDWMPKVGGRIVNLAIEDLTFSADGPLNCAESAVPRLNAALFRLELALIAHIENEVQAAPGSLNALFSLIAPGGSPQDLLAKAQANARRVSDPGGFRPSVRDGSSIIALLVRLFLKSTPDQLSRHGEAITAGLGCEASKNPSIVSVLFRPTQQNFSSQAMFGRDLLVTIYSAYQYATAAMHSDSYPRYPVALIHAVSGHLTAELDNFAAILEGEVEPTSSNAGA